ncbi:tripartite tricarboxylate transporter substrate binding protein [Verticiella sediminum]|uniref:Tripartite tricarboxylate transporter substrate binding protein n=1 Tax=Verticiella sediminum TaxID=1247510 RepID=A0A556AUC1_9BURK|nr:tripartite tricarboxylate transporter substrate binding protein [Verticiella sediminum]TSH96506.1 tripartite tricarboxylate transporter substrate binding protein [Verticiella sediminum]
MAMHTRCMRSFVLGLLVAAALPALSSAAAEHYPARPITLVSPAPPGGGTDAIGRAMADAMSRSAGVPVVVENRPGAYSQIATAMVAKAPADGYTLLLVASGHTVNPAVFRELPYDTQADFSAVAQIATAPAVLVANPGLGVSTVAELRAYARQHPERATFASSEASIQLMTSELGAQLPAPPTIVYYKGTGPSINDVLGGHVGFAVTSIASVLPHLQAGRLVPIAVTGKRRAEALPDVPTFQEQGLSGLESTVWQGILVPAGTPAEVIDFLNARVNEALQDPAVGARLRTSAYEPVGGDPAVFSAFLAQDMERQAALVRSAGMVPQ